MIMLTMTNILHFLQNLGFDRYSIIGWSDGTKVSLMIGRMCGHGVVRSLVLQSVTTYYTQIFNKRLLWSRNVKNWERETMLKYSQAYGNEARVAYLWGKFVDFMVDKFANQYPQGLLGPTEEGLAQVKSPTLVLHGDKVWQQYITVFEHVDKILFRISLWNSNNHCMWQTTFQTGKLSAFQKVSIICIKRNLEGTKKLWKVFLNKTNDGIQTCMK